MQHMVKLTRCTFLNSMVPPMSLLAGGALKDQVPMPGPVVTADAVTGGELLTQLIPHFCPNGVEQRSQHVSAHWWSWCRRLPPNNSGHVGRKVIKVKVVAVMVDDVDAAVVASGKLVMSPTSNYRFPLQLLQQTAPTSTNSFNSSCPLTRYSNPATHAPFAQGSLSRLTTFNLPLNYI